MKATIFIILTVGLCFFLCSFSGNRAETYTLTVKVENYKTQKALYSSPFTTKTAQYLMKITEIITD
jgi:hypothetical protein